MGGLMMLPFEARQAGAPPNWIFYGAVPDTDATVRRATAALGAEVVAGVNEVPTVGRFAVLKDPQGAVFAILQPAGEVPGHDGEPGQGEFSWHELATTDPSAAWDFYRAIFGWEKTDAIDMGPQGLYQMYGRAGRPLGGIYRKPAEMPGPSNWMCYVRVASADATAETVERLGGKVLNGPMEVPGGDRIAQCLDPQGAAFAVHSVAAAAAARPEPKKAVTKAAKQVRKKVKRTVKKAKRAVKKARKKTKKTVKRIGRKKKR